MGARRTPLAATARIRGRQGQADVVIDLRRVRRARYEAMAKSGPEFDNDLAFADRVKLSRSAVSRFFGGGPTSMGTARAIVKALGLKLADVSHPDEGESSRT